MVNFKETLTNLHKLYPEWDLDTLLKVMECIVEESNYPNNIKDLTRTYTVTQ